MSYQIFELLNNIHTVVGVVSICQLMTSSHTVIVHPLLVFLEYGWYDQVTPCCCCDILISTNIYQLYSSVITGTYVAALQLSATDVSCWSVKELYTSWHFRGGYF